MTPAETSPVGPKKRVVMLHNIVPPYRVPLFNAVASHPAVDLRILFMARTEANRSWDVPERLDFQHEFLRGAHWRLRGGAWTLHVNPGVVGAIRRHDPDVVVLTGYDSLTQYLAALSLHRGRRRRCVFWSESNGVGKPPEEGIRALPKRWMLRHADHMLVPGKMATDYLRRFTRPDVPFSIFPNVVDEALFRMEPGRRDALRREARERIGLSGRVVLFSGQMIPRKGFDTLLEAFGAARLPDSTTLLAVGEGPMRSDAETLAGSLPAGKRLVVLPFQQIQALPAIYAAADLLVLPSRLDPWPLVVVEAMNARLPVIVSDAVGNGPDLVRVGETGWISRTGDPESLRSALESALAHDLERAGTQAHAWVGAYCSLEGCVRSFGQAVGAE